MAPSGQYRQIQPAPVRGTRPGASSSASSTSWLSAKGGLTKRIKAVTQACHVCRRNKAKCDGVRPRCGACVARDAPCGYEGEAGQSRQAAIRTRLAALEKLVIALQSKPEEEAERLFHQLRTTDDAIFIHGGDTSAFSMGSDTPTPALSMGGDTTGSSTLAASSTASEFSFADPSPRTASSASPPGASSGPLQRVADLGEPVNFTLPSAQTTWAGIQSFFSSCGKLFHIYSQQQLETYYRMVFGINGRPDTSQKLAICCLSAVAAVGIHYNPGDFEKGLEKIFHGVSRRFFSEVMEERPLDTIKVCTLFAMYNIMDKATVALAYVEVGLSMSKRQSQNTGVCHPSMSSDEDWLDFRRTWRSLLFFSSWLSSTLGYISGAEHSDFPTLLPVAEEDYDSYSAEVGELVQAEMTKLSLLKAGILRNHLAVQEISTLGMDGIIRELHEWHDQLPEPLKLRSLHRTDWQPLVRWSIYHLHILYHGAFMLVYRRIATHCVRLRRTGGDLATAARETTLRDLVEQGVTSARDTARIVSLLWGEQGVFKRCWIVIFQAHTACVAIMHSIAQKQLHRFPPSSWAEDVKRAQQCLDVLGYCGNADAVALRFRVRLSGIFNSLAHFVPEGQTQTMQRVADWADQLGGSGGADGGDGGGGGGNGGGSEPHPVDYLFTIPPEPNQRLLRLSFSLLFALCRPWSDSTAQLVAATTDAPAAAAATMATTTVLGGQATGGGGGGADGQKIEPGTEDPSQLLERLEWDFDKVTPFRWDTDGMGMLKQGEVVDPSCFLDSEAPSGWALAEDVEGEVDGEGEEGADTMVE